MQNNNENTESTEHSGTKKQNMDYPNMPATSQKVNNEEKTREEIHQASELNSEGKTDNVEKTPNSGN